MATSSIYYLNGPSLSSATSVYTDITLTTVAADGWYSDRTIVRELVGGVFTNVISSCHCAIPCSELPLSIIEPAMLIAATLNVGGTSLDVGAIVIYIDFNADATPLGVSFVYDGGYYNTFSRQLDGWAQGPPNEWIYIGDSAFDCGIVAMGATTLPFYRVNPSTLSIDNTGGFATVTATAPQLFLSAGNPGRCVMVIPKLISYLWQITSVYSLLCNPNNVNITINCPSALPSFTSTLMYASDAEACGSSTDQRYYSADVNGTTLSEGFLGLYDWVFSDSYGSSILPDGYYRSPSVDAPNTYFQTQNGVIIAFGACGAYPEYRVDYQATNAIPGLCSGNVTFLGIIISQPPTANYVDAHANVTGTEYIPGGITHVQLRLVWEEVVSGCGQMRMTIEKNYVIIASKTFTPVAGVDEYLDVDFILDDDATIYGYITSA